MSNIDPVVPGPIVFAPDAKKPILFLPVRIETRFVGSQLLVRIYPDQISVDAHDPQLAPGEVQDGQAYWTTLWRAGKGPDAEDAARAAWSDLASRYHAPRAAWIVKSLTPTNPNDRPAQATKADQPLAVAPAFPNPPQRTQKIWNPARAVALPDHWTVVAKPKGGAAIVTQSKPIAGDLNVSIDPSGGAFPPDSPVDANMRWMVDFDVAEAAGMAVRVALDAKTKVDGFESIMVYGLRTSDGNPAATLTALLTSHRYSDGLAVVPQGAPTNNTSDVAALYKRTGDEGDQSYAWEIGAQKPADADDDGSRLAQYLGIDPTAFERIENARGFGGRNGRNMMTALWPATLGYFLSEIMASTFTDAEIEAGRQWTLANAIPRGPLPAIRVGDTPYGILPVTALESYDQPSGIRLLPSVSVEPRLVGLIQKLRETWVKSSESAPHVGAGDPDQDLLHVLGMDASSTTLHGRTVVGDSFLYNWLLLIALPDASRMKWWSAHEAWTQQVIAKYGSPSWDPRVAHLNFRADDFNIWYPTVSNKPLSETDQLDDDAKVGADKMNYIRWLATASIADVRNEHYPGLAVPTSILYKLLRQAILREYANTAMNAEFQAGRLPANFLREVELVNVALAAPTITPHEVLARPAPAAPSLSWAQYLVALNPAAAISPHPQLAQLRLSFEALAALPTAELDRLLTETFDACSHRLDVWITAIVNSRLQAARASDKGLHLGAFSWVENVKPAPARALVSGQEREAVTLLDTARAQKTKVQRALPLARVPHEDNGGFIHAPSYEQAAAAAVLRAGYMTHRDTPSAGLLAVDISSERVERARFMLEGVRQGQRLSALMGFQFEDGLIAAGMQEYIQPFRDRFPMMPDNLTPSSPGSEAVAASDVVNALALLNAWEAALLLPNGDWGAGMPPPGSARDTVFELLRGLHDVMDALSDLSVAEAVYQTMRGNFARAGGLMDAVSRGTYAPDPQVIDTPRGGFDVTHRLAILFAGDAPALGAGWTATPRSIAEPWLSAWAASLLPDPATVRCMVSDGTTTKPLTLADLGFGPLDFLVLSDAFRTPQRSELEDRIRFAANLAPDITKVSITFDPAALPPNSVSFPDAITCARALRDLLGAARPLAPKDLCEPAVDAAKVGGALDAGEIDGRLTAVKGRLGNDIAALEAAIAGGAPDPVRAAMIAASFYGIGGVPATSTGADADLVPRAQVFLAALKKRGDDVGKLPAASADDKAAALRAVFGNDTPILPRMSAPNDAALQSALAASSSLLNDDALAPRRWLDQLRYVRPAVARFSFAYAGARLLDAAARPDLTIAQLPPLPQPPDRWCALPLDPNVPFVSGRVALASVVVGAPAGSYAGLMIDEWPERIPTTKQSAAVAFHFDEPKARAPQALLLATCPDQRATWDDALIQATLADALELAKIRAVDLDSVIEVGAVLPALYVPFNLEQATVSTRFVLNAAELVTFKGT
jgi:hypothetical protein